MAKLLFDQAGSRFYETGVKEVVLFVYNGTAYDNGVAWNGVTNISESPSGAEATPLYADDIKYLNLVSAEEFGASIEAYTYPEEFAQCDGSASIGGENVKGIMVGQQSRKTFALAYKTTVGNDSEGTDYGSKLHIIYGCLAAPSEKAYATINDSPEAITFSWEISTTPTTEVPEGVKPTSTVVIDEKKVGAAAWGKIIDKIYGSGTGETGTMSTLIMPNEFATLIAA